MAGDDNAGSFDIFVRAYRPAGTVLWTQQFGSTRQDLARAVATDAAGSVFVPAPPRAASCRATPRSEGFLTTGMGSSTAFGLDPGGRVTGTYLSGEAE